MRQTAKENGLVIQAIAGTYVVLLGWDLEDVALKQGLLGFAILRTDLTENERYWLPSMKIFPGEVGTLGVNGSTRKQPIQSFQWGDYTAKPAHSYRYQLTPLYGAPGALTEGNSVTVSVDTEIEHEQSHSVYFNRGAVASQEYARRFQNKKPSVAGPAAYNWLSRGLIESITHFIARAQDAGYGLRGAFYEFQWPSVLDQLHAANERGADVRIMFDAIANPGHDPVDKNHEAISAAKIGSFCKGFEHGKLMHNKFMVLTKQGKPVAVLTGSTNLTENGLFGHLNCTHVVEDAAVAADYLAYWTELQKDGGASAMKDFTGARGALTAHPPPNSVMAVFSPLPGLATLTTYGQIADRAEHGLFMTFAFGMNKVFQPAFRKPDSVLRFALMEKEGNGAGLEQAKLDIDQIRRRPNVQVAIGHNIEVNSFDHWLKEISTPVARANVHWVHTKFMLVDPLGTDPIVVSGSANFSDASTTTNEENMLVIRGNTRVADIYLGEFMRSFAHYAFREAVYKYQQKPGADAEQWQPQFLATDNAWLNDYFRPGSARALKRAYFAGSQQN
jgi:hypothetical protein